MVRTCSVRVLSAHEVQALRVAATSGYAALDWTVWIS
jgi:hypothetical protein